MGKDISIVVLGSGGVGKSCITIQFIQGTFVSAYDATIEDIYRKRINVDGSQEVLMIVDTAGQDAFGSMREQYMKSGHGFLLVYSITDAESFHQLKKIYGSLRRSKGEASEGLDEEDDMGGGGGGGGGGSLPCLVIGNKSDLSAQRVISTEEGQAFAAENGCAFVETTAMSNTQVEDAFTTIVRLVKGGGKLSSLKGSTSSSSGGGTAPATAPASAAGSAATDASSSTSTAATAAAAEGDSGSGGGDAEAKASSAEAGDGGAPAPAAAKGDDTTTDASSAQAPKPPPASEVNRNEDTATPGAAAAAAAPPEPKKKDKKKKKKFKCVLL